MREETETGGGHKPRLYILCLGTLRREHMLMPIWPRALLLCALLFCAKHYNKEPFNQIMTNDLPEVKKLVDVLSNVHKGWSWFAMHVLEPTARSC